MDLKELSKVRRQRVQAEKALFRSLVVDVGQAETPFRLAARVWPRFLPAAQQERLGLIPRGLVEQLVAHLISHNSLRFAGN